MASALKLFDQAVAIDPGFAPALGWAAICHTRRRLDGYAEDPETSRRKAKSLAEQALARAGGDLGVLANVAMTLGDDENAEITSAIALIPAKRKPQRGTPGFSSIAIERGGGGDGSPIIS
jgi:hypothetical protein